MNSQRDTPSRASDAAALRQTTLEEFEQTLAASKDGHYELRLYVSGSTARSTAAVENVTRILEKHLPGRYDLEVVDLYQQPELARRQSLVAAPTLVKQVPVPVRRLVGDMSDEDKVLVGLDLRRRS